MWIYFKSTARINYTTETEHKVMYLTYNRLIKTLYCSRSKNACILDITSPNTAYQNYFLMYSAHIHQRRHLHVYLYRKTTYKTSKYIYYNQSK